MDAGGGGTEGGHQQSAVVAQHLDNVEVQPHQEVHGVVQHAGAEQETTKQEAASSHGGNTAF